MMERPVGRRQLDLLVRAANALEPNRIPPPIRAEVTFLLTRISQRGRCIGALDLRKSCCKNGLSRRQGEARCGQSVARICLDLHRLKGGRWWLLSMAA